MLRIIWIFKKIFNQTFERTVYLRNWCKDKDVVYERHFSRGLCSRWSSQRFSNSLCFYDKNYDRIIEQYGQDRESSQSDVHVKLLGRNCEEIKFFLKGWGEIKWQRELCKCRRLSIVKNSLVETSSVSLAPERSCIENCLSAISPCLHDYQSFRKRALKQYFF